MTDQPIAGVLEPKERRHFSPSELTEFFSCPLRHWYRYRLGLWTDTTSSYFAMGSAVHAGLERFYGEKIAGRPRDPDGARVFYRRAAGIERAQLKWFAAVAALSAPALLVGLALSDVFFLVAFLGFALLPVANGIAILCYKLYEIDRLISRTIGYAVLTAVVAGLFVGFILALQAVLAPLTRSNELAVAGSTLVVAALFQPIRRRVAPLGSHPGSGQGSHLTRIIRNPPPELRVKLDPAIRQDGSEPGLLAT
jgi:hypothetical protein